MEAFDPIVAAFVGNNTWFAVLMVVHVMGAVLGLGPTFVFGILGPMAGKSTPQGGLAIMEAMHAIEWKLVEPILLTVQPLTGALLIWNRGLNNSFFSWRRAWLIASILAYVTAMFLSIRVASRANVRMIEMAKAGQGGSPEFMKLVGISQRVGPVLGILGMTILVLMAWKPGSGCGPSLRC